jgi:hypothetical protein
MSTNNGINNFVTAGNSTLLDSKNASNDATLNFVEGFSSDYVSYIFEFDDVQISTPDEDQFIFQVSTDGGTTWDTGTNYTSVLMGYNDSGAVNFVAPNATAGALIASDAYFVREGVYGQMRFYGLSQSTRPKRSLIETTWGDLAGDTCYCSGSVWYTVASTTIVNGVRFKFVTGNILSGTIRMFGVT